MTVPIIFRDIDFHIYTISPDCKIYKNGEVVPIDDIIYHSTNGFDYVLLETLSGEKKLYMLDFVMYNSFHPQTQYNHKHFKVFHLDGDNNNHHIDNLDYEEDVEEWREVVYPETVKRGMYAVSSWGRVKNIKTNRLLAMIYRHDGYLQTNVSVGNSKSYGYLTDQIVAKHFISNINNVPFVNHIDGDKTNNHVSNLEWVTQQLNVRHSVLLGLRKYGIERETPSNDEINMVISMLLNPTYNGSATKVSNAIDRGQHPSITYQLIKSIKNKSFDSTNFQLSYDLKTLDFSNPQETKISTEDVDMVIELLLDPQFNGSVKLVYDAIDHNRFPYITKPVIQMIKQKRSPYIRVDSKYDLMSIKFIDASKTSSISTEDVDMVIELLLDPQFNGSVKLVYDAIDHVKYPKLTRTVINHIKCKKPTYVRHDSKYDLNTIKFNKFR